MPAQRNKINNNDDLTNGLITIGEEQAANVDLMPQTSGRSTGGNAMARYAQLDTMLEGGQDFRDRLVNNNHNQVIRPGQVSAHA